ncbi:hypothetical protein AAVH_40316, partial [Aphelenchoides avenae]
VTATYTATYNESAIRRLIRHRRLVSIISLIVFLLVALGMLIPWVILPAIRGSSDSTKTGLESDPGSSSDPDAHGNPPPSKLKWTYSKTTGKCYILTSTDSYNGGVSTCQSLGGSAVSTHSANDENAVF